MKYWKIEALLIDTDEDNPFLKNELLEELRLDLSAGLILNVDKIEIQELTKEKFEEKIK